MLGQSVGPFGTEKSKKLASELFGQVRMIVLRESLSKRYLEEVFEQRVTNVQVSTDIAFAYNYPKEKIVDRTERKQRILVNFREFNTIGSEELVSKACEIVRFLNGKGFGVDFLSTCQGVVGYKDDTEVADRMQDFLDKESGSIDFKIYRDKYALADYLEFVADYKYYIGMRMHAAIMPLLMDVPALNIGYEPKSKGVFSTIGLGHYALDICDSLPSLLKEIDFFLKNDYQNICDQFQLAKAEGYRKSRESFLSLVDI